MNEYLIAPQHENQSAIGCQNKVDAVGPIMGNIHLFNYVMFRKFQNAVFEI